jgi:lipid kinase, YegS/Rv2252/BmrU family
MNIFFLVNPVAGMQTILSDIADVMQVFLSAGHKVEMTKTKADVSVKELLETNLTGEEDMIICSGGDGTLNETISALLQMGKDIPIGYLPAGSTNDFSMGLNISKWPIEAAQNILNGTEKRLDIGKFEEKYFVYVASFGAFTQASYQTTQDMKNVIGHLAYLIECMKEIQNLKSYHVRVETETEVFEGEYLFGAVTNAVSLGGVIRLTDMGTDFGDGEFELILVKEPRDLIELSRVLIALMAGNTTDELIVKAKGRKFKFSCDEAIPWSLDGEYAQGNEQIEIENIHGAYRLMC